jgi:hypothetical protein
MAQFEVQRVFSHRLHGGALGVHPGLQRETLFKAGAAVRAYASQGRVADVHAVNLQENLIVETRPP